MNNEHFKRRIGLFKAKFKGNYLFLIKNE